jgi:folate-binding protein YgfZ
MSGAESIDEVREGYTALRRTAAVRRLPRDVLSVSGPDAASYLQGQCSQDVAALGEGGTAESLLLSPQGKIDVYLRLTRTGDDTFIVDTDDGFGSVVQARLERFRLRMKVVIEAVDWVCVALRGPDALQGVTGDPDLVAAVDWPGLSGVDLLGPAPGGGLSQWVGDQVFRCGDDAWEAARIEAGVPVNGREIVEGSIAAELGLVDRTVSFTKGCFTGQELVARIDARGSNVARRLCGVVVEGQPGRVSAPAGAAVLTADGSREVGHLSSVAWSPGAEATVALATLHRRVTPPEAVLLTWDDGEGTHTLPGDSRPLPMAGRPSGPAG